ncbi:MAG: hypothetical protein ABII13_05160 [Patescibacteria group bacterium]|nr:hypothetical protein [Patescibacteria group bacterium]MBU2508846.1 hypothetical protein [Patescibacteria group bacterium]
MDLKYISVVPVIRTPYGVNVFDYKIEEHSDLRIGDLIRVPFRNRKITALIVERKTESAYADRIIDLQDPEPLLHLSDLVIPLLKNAAARSFCSQPTTLQSWLRKIPAKIKSKEQEDGGTKTQLNLLPATSYKPQAVYVLDRQSTLIEQVRNMSGRVLILTAWQNRADQLSKKLQSSVLHSDMADGAAWKSWTEFVQSKQGILVATRIGAWLAHAADSIIVDEPENDDFKQDESEPRIDARWLVRTAAEQRPDLKVVSIGTTPPLSEFQNTEFRLPTIEYQLPIFYDHWQYGARSPVENISSHCEMQIQQALEENRPIVIIHPIRGHRSRSVCRDCGWTALCEFCSFPISCFETQGICGRCSRKSSIQVMCPKCGSADLNKSRMGKTQLEQEVKKHFGTEKIRVVDLPELRVLSITPNSLIIITDLSLIGGYSEDIRKRERLVVAWRRLAASASVAQSQILVQGSQELLEEARAWLTSEGLQNAWEKEIKERQTFSYPPAKTRIKILIDGTEKDAVILFSELSDTLADGWKLEGPFPVLFRSKTRNLRFVIHILPPDQTSEQQIRAFLEPFAKKAIIDLDPIAFLC